MKEWVLFSDKGYLSVKLQPDLFRYVNIKIAVTIKKRSEILLLYAEIILNILIFKAKIYLKNHH